jgi:hypothetical protein
MSIGFDFETDRIAGQRIIPPAVCLSVCADGERDLRAAIEPEYAALLGFLMETDERIVAHNAAFDLAVICFNHPEYLSAVWKALCDDRRVSCTIVREKLLHLTTHGNLEYLTLPDGSNSKIRFNLAALVQHYFGVDISDQKDESDSWRVNYSELRALRAQDYPEDARDYALDDAEFAVQIWQEQEDQRAKLKKDIGIDPFETEAFRVACDFALTLMTAWGVATDPEKYAEIKAMLEEALKPENTALLVEAGILRPAVPPRPHKRGTKNPDGTPKMTKGSNESIDQKKMRSHMLALKEQNPDEVSLRRTSPSERFPKGQLSFDAEWLDDHYHLCPILEQYRDRQKLQKLVTTELPRLMMLDEDGEHTDVLSPVVHPCFDVLKRTGRTSSFASKLYPSFNCQNVDPRARAMYVARPGCVLLSEDYSQMELGTHAQTCLRLFGKSVMADKINAGVDLHAFLGGSIAYNSDKEFQRICDDAGVASPDDIYEVFNGLRDGTDEAVRKFFKHYRTLAKPTGLGYPGGLRERTFIKYAKAVYGIVIDYKTAEMLRNVWLKVFPENVDYFEFINKECEDARNSPKVVHYYDEDGEEKTRKQQVYAYSTPLGMYRAGTDYCGASNGFGLQSPSAEGALMAVLNAARACYDPDMGSILYDDAEGPVCRPILFVHDEIICELREDDQMHERATALANIMIESMRVITPDVEPRVDMTLMRRWDKAAESVFDENGRLTIWSPDQ